MLSIQFPLATSLGIKLSKLKYTNITSITNPGLISRSFSLSLKSPKYVLHHTLQKLRVISYNFPELWTPVYDNMS